ncbi:MAG: spore coat U domain-containing protein [Thermodesulfobacteriota bacterium]
MRRISALFATGLVCFLFLFSGEALAQGCSVSAVTVQFGRYNPGGSAALDATGVINVKCDVGLAYTVRLDQGLNSGGGFFPRKMRHLSGADTIDYNLYRNSFLTEVWGDGTNSTFVRPGVGTGATEQLIFYARVPGGQSVAPGPYSDAVSVIIEW